MTAEEARAILGLKPGYTPNDLVAAFRERAKKLHPDGAGKQTDKEFADAVEAKKLLENTVVVSRVRVTHVSLFKLRRF